MNNQKFDDFDKYANQYREIHTKNIKKISGVDSNYFSEYKVKEVWSVEKDLFNGVILDFGCGDGNSAQFFLKYFSTISYYGIDISSNSIEVAKKLKLEKCRFKTFDGEKIPFPDNTFDFVFMAGVLHHVNSTYHKQIISECFRVMKSGGRLYIFEHNHLNPITRKVVNDCEFDLNAELVPLRRIKDIVKVIGFKKFKKRYTIFFPRKYLFKSLMPLEKYLYWCPLGGQYYVKCIK